MLNLNRTIVECKVLRPRQARSKIINLNRTIVECKEYDEVLVSVRRNDLNRTIVECKDIKRQSKTQDNIKFE